LKKPITKRVGGMAQGVGPEFKPQHCKKGKKKGSGRRGRVMEGMNRPGYSICIYGNVTMKPPV
jgi:hypothetical protein